jgi:poly(A) polymerase
MGGEAEKLRPSRLPPVLLLSLLAPRLSPCPYPLAPAPSKMPQMLPLIVPREAHTLSRRDVDPDALKVLYRLKDAGFTAYIVGGGVRDLLLGRRPKDFDIGTDAHPYQIKKLFRNCFIIGRRFRLAHIRFGTKVIEVATFRRQVTEEEQAEARARTADAEAAALEGAEPRDGEHDHLIHRDNTFGTAEEDAFRRDFTLNALFYDIATFSIIDYVGGLEDLRARVVRCIGDPVVRFREDPVRMQRAVSFAARLGFTIDPPVLDAIASERRRIALSAPARLAEEYFKILRSGAAERTFRELHRLGLLEPLSEVLHHQAGGALWASLARLDAYRLRSEAPPAALTNGVLLGSLIVPLGFSQAGWPAWMEDEGRPGLNLGVLPLPRRDVERVHQVLIMQRRLREPSRSPHARRMLMQRSAFADALAWLEIHGDEPDRLLYWREHGAPAGPSVGEPRSRRRRRGRRRPGFPSRRAPE